MILLLPFLLLGPAPPLFGQAPPLSADEIMTRVAENQERSKAAKTKYVFDMNVFVRLKRANGKPAREESRDYVVAPTDKGAERKLLKVEGKVVEGKKEIAYDDAKFRTKSLDIDGELTDSFAGDVMWNKDEFGPMVDWFPLTAEQKPKYTFHMEGEEKYRDYEVYKISFAEHGDGDCWRGEALIEKNEFQPVLVTAEWGCKIPAAVKILLGINVEHIGAKITYQRFDKDIWFPVSCGGELKLRVLFLYARTIAFSAKNGGFRRADVQSSVKFEREPEN